MRNIWIGFFVVIAAIALGVAAAWGAVALYNNHTARLQYEGPPSASTGFCTERRSQVPFSWNRFSGEQCGKSWSQKDRSSFSRPGIVPEKNWNMPGPMMRSWNYSNEQESTGRISMSQAVSNAESYLAALDYSEGLEVEEVMEFEDNFYVVVVEKETSKGAFELLVDPYSGTVFPEPGPNMMWNQKYGHMRRQVPEEQNSISLTEAKEMAQEALNKQKSSAVVEGMGIEFYGYYTFDYKINGQVAGMLSVNGFNGNVWLHTWHGDFIDEKEF